MTEHRTRAVLIVSDRRCGSRASAANTELSFCSKSYINKGTDWIRQPRVWTEAIPGHATDKEELSRRVTQTLLWRGNLTTSE